MNRSGSYRLLSVSGTLVLSSLVVFVAGTRDLQTLLLSLPILRAVPIAESPPRSQLIQTGVAVAVVVTAHIPLYKPRPRRILNTVELVARRVFLSVIVLAAIGYFDYTYRLPRSTVVVATLLLLPTLTAWFVSIRRHSSVERDRVVVVGNDPEQIKWIDSLDTLSVVGYVSPYRIGRSAAGAETTVDAIADGGDVIGQDGYLGGLSQLDEILIEEDIGTAVLAFETSNREDFFSVLDICHEKGVNAQVPRNQTDVVLVDDLETGPIVDVDLEPWDWQERFLKRIFDICFAVVGLAALAPISVLTAVAIKLDDGGPVFYRQQRTGTLGETFTVYKFRTMSTADAEAEPTSDADRVTRVGSLIRTLHLDEVPQLFSILRGHMSVVGPRAAWVKEEQYLEREESKWRKRWFVKPGLTGLAQINNVGSESPERKLNYDIRYVQEQSILTDLKIVLRQIFHVVQTLWWVLTDNDERE